MDNSEVIMDIEEAPMSEIPLLSDYADESTYTRAAKKDDSTETHKEPLTQPAQAPYKENPFLPYEHLAKLAMEREQFKQDLETFTNNMKQEGTYSARQSSQSNQMVQSITDKIIEQLKPVIQQQVSEEVAHYFKNSASLEKSQ